MKATDIPDSSRRAVRDRDPACRMCGRSDVPLELHHIVYRSQSRNQHGPENLIALCGPSLGFAGCHRIAHARPGLIRPVLLYVLDRPWLTGLAYLRMQGKPLTFGNRGAL